MFSPQKTATVAALVGGLAAVIVGTGHAYAGGKSDDCTNTVRGDVVCAKKSETYIDKDGTHVVKQEQDCASTDRPNVMFQDDSVLEGESTRDGAVVECSNTAKLPDGFTKPHINV
ncbi:hypothetical protein SAMN05428944_0121 [Streptomyces sp. 1222.5]|uniref:hypothetical protein n=1 Tax=unclassified Streptomyces TaxID=2593676 RepID=UPI00089A1BFF|nr:MULTISPECIES: hypothetical protein [unclassified Streptomyces]PKW05054.1 hypothetical protein BX260_0118 [Streptomyces sp. 5112.2]SEB53922.1 hypothetical protein SAMN05428944_0121 [Streptomyces sp. 1222.5]